MSDHDEARPNAGSVLSHLGSMVVVSVVLGVVVAGLAIPFAAVAGLTANRMADTLNELPAELETEALPQRTKILAADGSTLATIYDENRVNVSLTQVSKVMREAIVSIEDYRFYEHGALDVKGTLRAFVTNQAAGSVQQGGSSITQQMVKMTLLQQAKGDPELEKAATDDTFARKLRELRYAIAFEENYSKDWILERYLNIAYFGDGVYGVQAAARHYFSKDARKLNLREASTLAGLVKNPTGYDPTNNPDKALARRNLVLDRMAQLNVIKESRAERVSSKPLGLKITPNRNGCVFSRAPLFCDYVLSYLEADPSLGKTKTERRDLIRNGGLTIHTTVDLRFQKAADESVSRYVYPKDQAIGGLALVEPRTGNVKAIAQSRPYGPRKKEGETFLNYVVAKKYGDSNGFQPGSTFKAFVLASAIQQDISLSETIDSPQQRTFSEADYEDCDGEPYGYGTWPVSNSTTSGLKNMYTGTRESVNTFFAALEQRTGLCKPYRLAKKMGIDLDNPAKERVPSFTLGVADVSPLEMAEAYATFAGRGLHCDSRPVTKIADARGTVVKNYEKSCQQVLRSAVADAVNDVLRGVQEGGYGDQAGASIAQPSAAKTGTTTGQKAVWFVAYTPNLSGAAMIAGANSFGQPIGLPGQVIGGRPIGSASGSGFASPLWADAMDVIQQWLDDEDFVPPPAGEITGVLQTVPSTGGMSVEQATQVLEDANFEVAVGPTTWSSYPAGTVAFTSPGAGSQFSSGDTVTIYVSNGKTKPAPPPKKKKKKKGGGGGDSDGGGSGDDDGPGRGNGNGNGNRGRGND